MFSKDVGRDENVKPKDDVRPKLKSRQCNQAAKKQKQTSKAQPKRKHHNTRKKMPPLLFRYPSSGHVALSLFSSSLVCFFLFCLAFLSPLKLRKSRCRAELSLMAARLRGKRSAGKPPRAHSFLASFLCPIIFPRLSFVTSSMTVHHLILPTLLGI